MDSPIKSGNDKAGTVNNAKHVRGSNLDTIVNLSAQKTRPRFGEEVRVAESAGEREWLII